MTDEMVYIPFPRKLYNDIVRFSDGRIDPSGLAGDTVQNWVERNVESADYDNWGERLEEVAEKYAPHVLERWEREDAALQKNRREENKPLVWKDVSIPSGSEVRMYYDKDHHYAEVKRGKIVDNEREYSPSEWASKVAAGTSRNAWRDLWFREPLSRIWVPAQLLRDQAREAKRTAQSHSKEERNDKEST